MRLTACQGSTESQPQAAQLSQLLAPLLKTYSDSRYYESYYAVLCGDLLEQVHEFPRQLLAPHIKAYSDSRHYVIKRICVSLFDTVLYCSHVLWVISSSRSTQFPRQLLAPVFRGHSDSCHVPVPQVPFPLHFPHNCTHDQEQKKGKDYNYKDPNTMFITNHCNESLSAGHSACIRTYSTVLFLLSCHSTHCNP